MDDFHAIPLVDLAALEARARHDLLVHRDGYALPLKLEPLEQGPHTEGPGKSSYLAIELETHPLMTVGYALSNCQTPQNFNDASS